MRAFAIVLAIALGISALVYVASALGLTLIIALGAFSWEWIAMMGALGASAIASLVIAIFLLIRPSKGLLIAGSLFVAGAAIIPNQFMAKQ